MVKKRAYQTPLVTIITATYNSSRTLSLALRSALGQGHKNFELLVVGDACTDDSEIVVRRLRDDRIRWLNLEVNSGGQAGPNNEGLRHARGRYIAFLGHDDLWFPWHLSSLIGFMRSSRADTVHSLCPLIGPKGVYEILGAPREGVRYDWHFVPPSCWLMSRESASLVGPWPDPSTIDRGVDFEVLRRLQSRGARIACLPELTILKFPSADWGIYASRNGHPQKEHWMRMQRDARGLAHSVVLDFAAQYSRTKSELDLLPLDTAFRGLSASFRVLRRSLLNTIVDAVGRDSSPVKKILVWRSARWQRKRRAQRGLT